MNNLNSVNAVKQLLTTLHARLDNDLSSFKNNQQNGSDGCYEISKEDLKKIKLFKFGELTGPAVDYQSTSTYNDPKLQILIEIAKMIIANGKQGQVPKSSNNLIMDQCKARALENNSVKCTNIVTSKNSPVCNLHQNILSIIRQALNLNRCKEFASYPRCLRSSEITDGFCQACGKNEDRAVTKQSIGICDIEKELNMITIIKEDEYQRVIQNAKNKIERCASLCKKSGLYIGVTSRESSFRHSYDNVLPLGSIIKTLIIFPTVPPAMRAEQELIRFAHQNPMIGHTRLLNVNDGGQNCAKDSEEAMSVYLGIIPQAALHLSRNFNMNRKTLMSVNHYQASSSSTKTDHHDLGTIMGMKLVKNFPTKNSLKLLQFLNLKF